MTSIGAILAFLIGIFGLISTTQATFGVGLIGFACLLAILVRISQAETQHKVKYEMGQTGGTNAWHAWARAAQ